VTAASPATSPDARRAAEADARAHIDTTVAALADLVRIPSISADGHDPEQPRRSAGATAELLREAGLEHVELLEVEGAHPYVVGDHLHAGDDAPTVLLYAHHDVQPVGTPERWASAPFEPTERDGRLFARGAADDKAGVMVHVAAVGAWLRTHGRLPCNVKVVVEGEEEIGSPHLHEFLDAHGQRLRADVIVLTDLPNWQVGWPGLTVALRGMGELSVRVRTMAQPVHSGMYGGPVPDALTATARLLATLHDEHGAITVEGFTQGLRELSPVERGRLAELDTDSDDVRRDARMLDGVAYTGDPDSNRWERIWYLPTITPIGIDAPGTNEASNTLLAEVTTKLSCRFAPGMDPERSLQALEEHLVAHAPFGAEVTLTRGHHNPAWTTEPDGPAFEAAMAALEQGYGRAPAVMGCGGSIPFVEPFSEAFGGAPCLLTGVEDPATNAHGEDESLHLGDFANAVAAEVHLLAELADRLG